MAAGGAETATAKASGPPTGPQPGANTMPTPPAAAAAETANHELVRCPHCHPSAGLVRKDRLQQHIANVHQKSSGGYVPFQGVAKSTPKYAQLPTPVKEGSNFQRCRACGKPAVPGQDHRPLRHRKQPGTPI